MECGKTIPNTLYLQRMFLTSFRRPLYPPEVLTADD